MGNLFKNKFILLLIPLVCLLIILFWFKEGKIISNTSEEELSIFHSRATAEIYSTFWYTGGTGLKTPFLFTRYPTFFTLGILEQIGIPAYLRQALLIWLLMVTGIVGMYLLLKSCFRLTMSYSLIGSLFYLLNIYSMTQVWKRMLYHGMFAWAYLPLFTFFWIKWLESNSKRWLLLFLFSSFFFADTFSQPAFIITIWSPALVFVLIKVWHSRLKVNKITQIFLKAGLGFFLWCVINLWWLHPMVMLGSTWTEATGQTWQTDLTSLEGVSKSFPIWEVLLLRQSWYFSPDNDFGNFYQNPFIIFISILILFFVLFAIFKIKKFANRGFVLTIALIGIFISKGTNFPLGYIFFYLLFSILPFSAAFRNSYEKFGIVWLLAYTILFTLGFSKFLSLLKPDKRYLIGSSILILILVLTFPMWSGSLFPQRHRISVPSYYEAANLFLNERSKDRLFNIPFVSELENSSYSWGFVGGDPTPALFDLDSITKPKIPLYTKISEILPQYLKDKNFPKILGWLGVGNVVLHKDSIYPKIDIGEMIGNIKSWDGIINEKEIGELIIYSLDKKLINERIYTANTIINVQSLKEGLEQVISDEFNTRNSIFSLGNSPKDSISLIQTLPQVQWNKVSNDYYQVKIKEANGAFILVLNDTFDKSWQAKIDNIISDEHFIVNGFANGWLIQKTGNYEVDIRLKVWPWD